MPKTVVNPLNQLEYSNRQGYSKFDLSKLVGSTLRFGELVPFHSFRTVLVKMLQLK